MKLPTIKVLAALVASLKEHGIEDDFLAFEDDDTPGIQLTVGWSPETGDWDYQTGDNSVTGAAYHYPVWAVVGVYRNSNSREVAKDIRSQLDEETWQ